MKLKPIKWIEEEGHVIAKVLGYDLSISIEPDGTYRTAFYTSGIRTQLVKGITSEESAKEILINQFLLPAIKQYIE